MEGVWNYFYGLWTWTAAGGCHNADAPPSTCREMHSPSFLRAIFCRFARIPLRFSIFFKTSRVRRSECSENGESRDSFFFSALQTLYQPLAVICSKDVVAEE